MPEVRLDTVWSDDQVMQVSTSLYNMLELHATCAVLHAGRPVVISQDATQMLAIPLVVKAGWCSNAHSQSVYRLLNVTEIAAQSM